MFYITSESAILVVSYAVLCFCGVYFGAVLSTWSFTMLRWKWDLRYNEIGSGKTRSPIKIPYAYPILGSAPAFLKQEKGWFWTELFKQHPRDTGACTLKMGGKSMHILYDFHAIQALFKARGPHRDHFTMDVMIKGFGIERLEAIKSTGIDEVSSEELRGRTTRVELERLWTEYLLKANCVNELTDKFTSCLREQFASELHESRENTMIGLSSWVREQVFRASTTTIFGPTVLEDCPSLEEDYYEFDKSFMTCYFGIPKWMAPKAYAVRDKITRDLVRWTELNLKRFKDRVVDPDGDTAWEPNFGSRINRARVLFYESHNLNTRTRALMDLGFIFGVSSNSIPAVSWYLVHVLNPHGDKALYPRVMAEINASKRPDGSFDISLLSNQPLMLSILYEILRLYVDNLVTRELPEDLTLPVGDPRINDKLFLRKGSIVVAPSWLQQRGDDAWHAYGAPASEFHAERFLTTDTSTGETGFSTAGTAGRLFPFGGGKTICPGRVFARQEILISVAVILSTFDVQALQFVDGKGKECEKFPTLADGYPGAAVMDMCGDLRVRISRKGL